MNTRLLVIVALLAAGGVAGVVLSRSGAPTAAPSTPTAGATCVPVPSPAPKSRRLPADLPLPRGSYPVAASAATAGVLTGTYAVPSTLQEFVAFATERWAAEGWKLEGGESEPGEAEGVFAASPTKRARFTAREGYCDGYLAVAIQVTV